ncbi:hypothetical protein [Halobacteriovorax sp. JY17]|uniref:hypothetical protein n=1 Tax=Halobacteriovorax sp. JY17 TaxID=2014617 RepID=UPI000C3F63D1|nr:hypothetical protein [Halobacteriovorax sp. JY17]PIK15709.1 MAG: hypothetical protein CES88_02985 [Halobacteriovorax sp. JY17]
MKWLFILQFTLFSLFSIAEIGQDHGSKNIIYLEQVEISSPLSTNKPIKPASDYSLKYINLSTKFNIRLKQKSFTFSNFNSHLYKINPSTKLARSPPTPLS